MSVIRECSKNAHHDVGTLDKYCLVCGAPTKMRRCPKCSGVLSLTQRYCGGCGENVADVDATIAASTQ